MAKKILQINSADNVAVVLQSIVPGEEINFNGKLLKINENIPSRT